MNLKSALASRFQNKKIGFIKPFIEIKSGNQFPLLKANFYLTKSDFQMLFFWNENRLSVRRFYLMWRYGCIFLLMSHANFFFLRNKSFWSKTQNKKKWHWHSQILSVLWVYSLINKIIELTRKLQEKNNKSIVAIFVIHYSLS